QKCGALGGPDRHLWHHGTGDLRRHPPAEKAFVAGCIGGAAGALVVALTGAKYYLYAGLPGLLATVYTINASDPASFTGEMIAVAVTIGVTIIMVQIIGCDEPGEKKSNT